VGRQALFGGTFDPVHNAHVTVATEAADVYELSEVLFIPARNPPHKADSTTASYPDRFRMVELACEADPRFVASRLEQGHGRSYSINTIEKLWSPDQPLYFIIGADAFAEIKTWHRWNDVVRLTDFIVVTRPGHVYAAPPQARVHRLDTLALPVSSSDIRSKLAQREIPDALPRAVGQYIVEHGLYGWRTVTA
jgi:nicotinate-nucleotide adenylyltransferase